MIINMDVLNTNGGCFVAGYFVVGYFVAWMFGRRCLVADFSLNEIIESSLTTFSHIFKQIINDNHPPLHEIEIPLSRAI